MNEYLFYIIVIAIFLYFLYQQYYLWGADIESLGYQSDWQWKLGGSDQPTALWWGYAVGGNGPLSDIVD